MKAAGLILLLALAPAAASASPLPRYGTFVYSSLCWEKESGDASGVRFALTRGRAGDTLVYEYGNGPLEGARIKSLSPETGSRRKPRPMTASWAWRRRWRRAGRRCRSCSISRRIEDPTCAC